ncbi:hypothetical protein TNCV_3118451 [Trichonephila clavipes]|uniref:Uncharacterized protein n=1 Tax=Trichonephila clavipes TaxID=2585209 RepID=A0A8X6W9N3_TRICX|nr:hypothetical protein TNCV_3118451 [Trichonephila clavipes]
MDRQRLSATGPFPLPVGLGGEEREKKVESPNRIEPKVALAAQSLSTCTRVSNHVDIHLGTYNPTRCVGCLFKAHDITQNVFKTGHSFVRFTQILLTGLT